MEKTYTQYLNELSGNRMDVLEEIISKKFKKFKKMYKILSRRSSDIAHISYRFSESEDSLDVDITVNPDIDVDDFISSISTETEDNYILQAESESRMAYLSIILDEE